MALALAFDVLFFYWPQLCANDDWQSLNLVFFCLKHLLIYLCPRYFFLDPLHGVLPN
jgi:hypothetical protein